MSELNLNTVIGCLLITLFITTSCSEKEPTQTLSMSFYGSSGEDVFYSANSLPKGGFLVAASSETPKFGKQILLIELNNLGSVTNEVLYGDTLNEKPGFVNIDNSGNVVLLGNRTLPNSQIQNQLYARYSSNYVLQFDTMYASLNNEICHDAVLLEDGSVVMLGTTDKENVLYGNPKGITDVLVRKIDPSGNILWEYSYGGAKGDVGNRILAFEDKFYIVGSSESFTSAEKLLWNVLVLQLNQNGSLTDMAIYGGNGNDFGESAIIDKTGCIFIVGSYTVSSAQKHSDLYLIHTGSSIHDLMLEKNFGTIEPDYGADIFLQDSTIFLCGNYDQKRQGANDIWLLQIDYNGLVSSEVFWGGAGQESVKQIIGGTDLNLFGDTKTGANSMLFLIKTPK